MAATDSAIPRRSLVFPVYTGKTEMPCCLCDDSDTVARLDLPPCAVPLMKHSGSIAWRDIVGEVSVHFCESDWTLVRELVLDVGTNPLSRCNVARATFDIREDFEALLNDVRSEPDHTELEKRMARESRHVLAAAERNEPRETHTLVEARIVQWVFEERGLAPMDA